MNINFLQHNIDSSTNVHSSEQFDELIKCYAPPLTVSCRL
jgi:hypothetical protein